MSRFQPSTQAESHPKSAPAFTIQPRLVCNNGGQFGGIHDAGDYRHLRTFAACRLRGREARQRTAGDVRQHGRTRRTSRFGGRGLDDLAIPAEQRSWRSGGRSRIDAACGIAVAGDGEQEQARSRRRAPLAKRLGEAGYPATLAVENVSAGYHTLAEAFSGWRDSPPHRENMLKNGVTKMGIAASYAPNTKYKVFWTLILASSGAAMTSA